MSTPTTKLARELVRTACRAPSIHNTQPWAWRLVGADTIELHADRSRQLSETDPDGRALVISCGAALHHLVVAADGFGLVADARTLPQSPDSDFLAEIHLAPGEFDAVSLDMMDALENRQTDRRGFTGWEVPEGRLRHLADAASGWGAQTMPITEPGLAARTRAFVEEARAEQRQNRKVVLEQWDWINHSPDDGVPGSSALPHRREGDPRDADRFDNRPVRGGHTTSSDALMLVFTSGDDQAAWLASGQTLSALWIRATYDGISLRPDTQVIEVERTRQQLRHHLLDDLGQPQMLVHVGWQERSRPAQRFTPRRSLEDVLLP
jgi:nitroreductase